MDLELKEIEKAAERLKSIIYPTNLTRSQTFSAITGGDIYLKPENLQKTGSFKIRGASNKIAKMLENGDRSPVVASSAGNHAQGVAYAAAKLGILSTVVMPKTAPIAKIEATKNYGANVVLYGSCYDDAYEKACELCREQNAEFIHPYNDPDVIAGQGTIGIEILKELPDADIVFVPAGGGGLLAGVSCAIKKLNPNVRVYGVQAKRADAIAESFQKGEKVKTETTDTIADGIAVKNPGDVPLELIRRYTDGILTVSEEEIAGAVLLLMERCKSVAEPAGAASVAAALSGQIDLKGKKVVCLLSGGNIDFTLTGRLINYALASKDRIAEIYILLSSNPDGLKKVVDIITENRGNIEDIQYDLSACFILPNQKQYYIKFLTDGEEQFRLIVDKLKEICLSVVTTRELTQTYTQAVLSGKEERP